MIRFECPHCGSGIKVNDSAAGKVGKCNKCGEKLTIPSPTEIVRPETEVVRPAESPAHYQPPQPLYQEPPRVASPNVSVNIRQDSRAANSMGIASVILGVMAFLLCWIPFVNILAFVLGGISFLMAVIGIFLGISRKGSGIGYSIAGGALSAIALFFSAGFFLALFGSAAVVSQAVDAANKERMRQQAIENPAIINENKQARPGAAPARMDQPKKPADKWAGKGLTETVGDVTVEIMGTDINHIQFKGITDREAGTSEEEFLLVKLKITNNSDVKKYSYSPWKSGRFGNDPLLTDEHGNTYVARDPTFQTIVGSVKYKELYPGESVEDLYAFERPVGKASKFKMNLYSRDFTGGEPVLLKFACSKKLIAEAKSQSEKNQDDSEKPVMLRGAPKADSNPLPEFNDVSTAGEIKAEITKIAVEEFQGKECLAIHLKLTNNGGSKQTYSTWQSKYYSSGDLLTDDLGKAYESVTVKLDSQTIEPGATIEDTLYFEKPDPKATKFNLFLYPRAFTEKQPFNFKFELDE
ncbi:DUF5067 domain-containing protein [Gimesia chilikensis]|uniref:DUF5067 domain-containing protein n=1 Tax=Gimesia chilikensis TaxID=2605989 RepID=UPI003A9591A4